MRKVMLDDQCINDVSLWVKNSWKDISDSIESFRREISFDLNNWKITMLRTTPKFKNFFYCVEQYTNSDKFTYSYDEV